MGDCAPPLLLPRFLTQANQSRDCKDSVSANKYPLSSRCVVLSTPPAVLLCFSSTRELMNHSNGLRYHSLMPLSTLLSRAALTQPVQFCPSGSLFRSNAFFRNWIFLALYFCFLWFVQTSSWPGFSLSSLDLPPRGFNHRKNSSAFSTSTPC